MLLKSRASPYMLPFGLCNKQRLAIWHMNRPLFPKTLSIPFCDIGKYVGLRTYQHPLISLPIRRGPGVFMNVSVQEYHAHNNYIF